MMNYGFKKFFAFTLAEVLITLGIIGVVAALTIPTLVSNYKQRAWDTAANVFERKLEESLKTMNTQQTLAGYSNTADFVNELSKHFKITRVCKNDDLLTCFEDKVMWGAGDADPEEVDMANIKTASHFGQEDWDTEIIGVQFANGTTGLVAYNPDCKQNPYSNQITGTSCLAMLYDTDGFKTPNTSGKDLRSINVSKLGRNCAFELGGSCFGAPFTPTPLTKAECEAEKSNLGIKECYNNDDVWAGAVKACGGVSKMPTLAQVAEIANYVYNTSGIGVQGGQYNLTLDYDKASALGFTVTLGSTFYVWTGEEYTYSVTYGRRFGPTDTSRTASSRRYIYNSGHQAICIAD